MKLKNSIKTTNTNYFFMNSKLFTSQTIFLFIILVCSFPVKAQKAPIKFGKIDKADLEMKTYPADTSAIAVILYDYGHFEGFQFTHTLRIKILKKEGTSYGSQVFPINAQKSDIKGIVYNLENGEIVESKLKPESIFKERVVENYYRVRIAMPNVKEGSVIDIEFIYLGLPTEWRFQDQIPVRWSELVIEPNKNVEFRKHFYGNQSLAINEEGRWVAKDVPSFKPEAYMSSVSDYITKFEIDILRVSSHYFVQEYTTTWEDVNIILKNYYGELLKGFAIYLNTICKEIENKNSFPLDKIKASLEAVKKIKWNENITSFTTTPNLNSVYNKKIGNSAEINLVLIQLLRKLGLEAYPVVLSTRDNGSIFIFSPSLFKFNYVIACAKVDGKTYLLDATEELMPMGLIPERCINGQGRLVDEEKPAWVDLSNTKKEKKTIMYDLKLGPDKMLNGKISTARYDYSAFNFRKSYQKFNSQDEYLKDFEKNKQGLTVLNCKINNLDSIYKQLNEDYDVKIKDKINNSGNMLYLNPMFFEQLTENPFKMDVRQFPVDFIYPKEELYFLKLSIPEGYHVEEVPKSLTLKLPDNSASCSYQISISGNTLQLRFKFAINKPVFTIIEYADLKTFYSEIIKKQSENIILKSNK
jgi:hypothetical protein